MKVAYTEPIFCPVDHYTCMMPAEYELNTSDGCYHKVRMACNSVLNGKCTNATQCEHFMKAPEIAQKYLLRDK